MPSFELESYKKLIDAKAEELSTDFLANAGAAHAGIAMSKLFERTNHEVQMVVGSFAGPISCQQDYLRELKKCVDDKHVSFKIIFLDSPNFHSEALEYLVKSKESNKNIEFRQASSEFIKQLTVEGERKHFSVYDDLMFRFEKDTINYLAWFSFNSIEKASELKAIFAKEFAKQPPLDIKASQFAN